jgi:hypothetical protein
MTTERRNLSGLVVGRLLGFRRGGRRARRRKEDEKDDD